MLFKDLEFHNVEEILPSGEGYRLHRFPRQAREQMGEGASTYGRYICQLTTGCEIRFVTEGDRVQLSLSSFDVDGFIHVFRGDFKYATYRVEAGKVNHFMLTKSPQFEALPAAYKRGRFSPDVWRILSGHDFGLTFVDIEPFGYRLRPPLPEEKPDKTLLVYGTSITHGACAAAYTLAYSQYLGRLLGCEILNKGMGGSCMNEAAVADYFASLGFDAVLLENEVNMGTAMAEEYARNGAYLLDRLAVSHPDCPIWAVTAYPNASLSGADPSDPCVKKPFVNDDALRKMAAGYPNVHIIEGDTVLTDFTGLQCDLIHLNDYGHIQVAQRLAQLIGPL